MQTNSEGPLAYIADFSLCSSWPCLSGQSWDSNPRSRTALRGSTRHPSEPPVCCISSPALGLPNGGPSCAPCDPASLPGVDRWALRPVSATAATASNLVLVGVAASAAFLSVHDRAGAQARGNAAVLANSVAWTAATTEWLKVIVRRKRPVLYTGDATAAAADKENQESLPSGHASVAFAAATSYWVLARRERLPHRTRNTIFLYAGAAGVAALRVAAGKHFPTDVLAGAALGSAVGWLVPTIHPTQP